MNLNHLKLSLLVFFTLLLSPIIIDKSVEALYGGAIESGYEFVGYGVFIDEIGTKYICGVNFINKNTAITSAHCLFETNIKEIYVGLGEYSSDFKTSGFKVEKFSSHPYFFNPEKVYEAAIMDVAILELNNDVNLDEYAEISDGEIGCNYHIVGYGNNEIEITGSRRGGDVCIRYKESNMFNLEPGVTHFCKGDSGSGVYKKGTNQLVGLVSSFAPEESCVTASDYYVTRLIENYNMQYINGEIDTFDTLNYPTPTLAPTISETTIPQSAIVEDDNSSIFWIIFVSICIFSFLFTVLCILILYKVIKK